MGVLVTGCDYDPRPPVTASASGTAAVAEGDIPMLRISLTVSGQPFDHAGVSLGASFRGDGDKLAVPGVILDTSGGKLPNRRDETAQTSLRFYDSVAMVPYLSCVELLCQGEVLAAPSLLERTVGSVDWFVGSSLIVDHTGGRTDEAAITIEVAETTAAAAGLAADWTVPMPFRVSDTFMWDLGGAHGLWPITVAVEGAALDGLVVEVTGSGFDFEHPAEFVDDDLLRMPGSGTVRPRAALRAADFECNGAQCTRSFYLDASDPSAAVGVATIHVALTHPGGLSVPFGSEVFVTVGELQPVP